MIDFEYNNNFKNLVIYTILFIFIIYKNGSSIINTRANNTSILCFCYSSYIYILETKKIELQQ